MTEELTFTQLLAVVQKNNIHITSSTLSNNSLLNILKEHNIDLSCMPPTTPKWEVHYKEDGKYEVCITSPASFTIKEGDHIIPPNDRTYLISYIYIDKFLNCIIELNDIEIEESRVLTAAEMVECVDCEDMCYIKNK